MIQEYINTTDVSRLLGVSVSTIKRLRKRPNGIPFTKVGGQIRYHIHIVRDWMYENQNRHKGSIDYSAPNNSEELH